ncbi:undecaprenyl-diphosphatase [Acinetobacter sp. MB5]|uniref:undecaprenyl-diphosphatase n=1 Tax=Acinetobacter sp. MB5 TaxID=2069438 RepID=UPI000DD0D02A|nr:undecaprenyl-diphosphatase [Acinetobacter sp. MB5]
MTLEALNLTWFSEINAPLHASHAMIDLAIFIANDVFYLLVLFLLFLWVYGDKQLKERALRAVFFTMISLGIGFIISTFYYHPRPFVMGVGHTFIQHAPDASFPSDHMLIFSTIAWSYLFSGRKFAGSVLLILAGLVAWSRVYLGVHFPMDMIGAFSIALLVNILGIWIWKFAGQSILHTSTQLYTIVCKPLLEKGWIK